MPDEVNGPAGPLVAGDPQACGLGNGTYYQPAGPCGTGLGAVDGFALLEPSGVYGCTDLGGYPANPFASFHLVVHAPLVTDCVGCGIADPFLEGNDTCQTAVPLTAGRTLGLVSEAGDDDFYSFTIPANGFVRILALFDAAGADLDLELYGAGCGTLLAASNATGNDELLEYFHCGGAPLSAVLRIPGPVSGCTNYDLIIEREVVVDDAFEDNDTCAQSILGGVTTFTTVGLLVTECDPDFFSLNVNDQRAVQISVLFDDQDSNVQMRLVDALCQTVLATGQLTPAGISASYFNTSGAAALVVAEVTTSGGKGFAQYSLAACYSVGDVIGFQVCAGVPNSTGRPATMCARGSDVALDNQVLFYAVDLPPLAFGYFITSPGSDLGACRA